MNKRLRSKNIVQESAYACALRFLARKDYSKLILAQKLKRAGYDDEQIKEAMSRLESDGYVNEAKCVQYKIKSEQQKRRGEQWIRFKLLREGFDEHLVEKELENSSSFSEELVRAQEALKQKFLTKSLKLQKDNNPKVLMQQKSKAYASALRFLLGRGFSYDVARTAVDNFFDSLQKQEYGVYHENIESV